MRNRGQAMNIGFIALLLALGSAQATDWQVQPDASTLRFAGRMQGEGFDGGFARFTAAIRFDPADLDSARFEVTVDLASVDSANAERDETLVGPGFFDVEHNPQARYTASRFRAEGDGFVAEGSLTLNGQTHPVPLHFRWTPSGAGAVLEGAARLDRLQFDVGAGDWADPDVIGHTVEVSTRLTLSPAAG